MALLQSLIEYAYINVCYGVRHLAMSLFVTYLLGRHTIDTSRAGILRGVMVVLWMILNMLAVMFRPLVYVLAVVEGLMAISLSSHYLVLTLTLRGRQRTFWLLRIALFILWGVGWGVLAIHYWLGMIDQIVLVLWFMTYAAAFPPRPRGETTPSPGRTPPPIATVQPGFFLEERGLRGFRDRTRERYASPGEPADAP